MQKLLFYSAIGVALYFSFFSSERTVSLGSGAMAPDTPIQYKLSYGEPFEFEGFTVTPLADYTIEAKLLSRKRYWGPGNESKISPIDFALGWGNLSDEDITSKMSLDQGGRWFHWTAGSDLSVPIREIERSTANVHIIPESDLVKSTVLGMKKGSVIYLQGKLVRVESQDGWKWQSSLTRDDTGDQACEVMFVESAYTVME